jgi:Leishmanolysin
MSDGQQISFRDISPLSLAALEDTGWYLVNYEKVNDSPMGRGASCEFLFEDCLDTNAVISPFGDQIFCNYNKFVGCSPDLKTKAICSLRNLTHLYGEKVPQEFNYFDNAVSAVNLLGDLVPDFDNSIFLSQAIGSLLMESTDFCPLYARYSGTFNDHYSFNCTNSSQTETAMQLEVFGPESKCVESSIPNSRFNYNMSDCKELYGCPSFPMLFNVPLCLNVRCNLVLEAVEIQIGEGTKICKFDGERMEIPKFPGAFIRCPRLASVCME